MHSSATALLLLLAASPANILAQARLEPIQLDSGAVVRLHWSDGTEKAPCSTQFGPGQ